MTLVSFRAVGKSENPGGWGLGHYITRLWLGASSNVVGVIPDWNRVSLSAIIRGGGAIAPHPLTPGSDGHECSRSRSLL